MQNNHLAALPQGAFDGLTSLKYLHLDDNHLATFPEGLFNGLTSLQSLHLRGNQLAALPEGAFEGISSLLYLDLTDNHLVGLTGNYLVDLTENDRLFAGLPSGATVSVGGQTEAPERPATRLAAAVPLMISASDSRRHGLVRIINESDESGAVRIFAFDDGGTAAEGIEIQLGANQAFHLNAGDLENGNADKGINTGIGSPGQGDWRLEVETALNVRVLAFVYTTTDGFLTDMHDLLPRDAEGRLAAKMFNPLGQDDRQVSKLRLVNTGANAENVRIAGVDDQGNAAGPVAMTLAAGESRTLSAQDLENGAEGLTGTLDDGAGKWRLLITAGQSVVGMSLLESPTGHLTNISTIGVATEAQ